MGRSKFTSPTLAIDLPPEDWEKAVKSSSGGCMIADKIVERYPHLSRVSVDMATIRVSDRKRGLRFVYLTPPAAQSVLLYFDQGWPQPIEELTIRRAVHVAPIKSSSKLAEKTRVERKTQLEEKKASGEPLTNREKATLKTLKARPPRPTTTGKAEVKAVEGKYPVVSGGKPPMQGKAHPNLLRGSDRHYGAKLADPGVVFKEAVDEAVAQKLAEKETSGE